MARVSGTPVHSWQVSRGAPPLTGKGSRLPPARYAHLSEGKAKADAATLLEVTVDVVAEAGVAGHADSGGGGNRRLNGLMQKGRITVVFTGAH